MPTDPQLLLLHASEGGGQGEDKGATRDKDDDDFLVPGKDTAPLGRQAPPSPSNPKELLPRERLLARLRAIEDILLPGGLVGGVAFWSSSQLGGSWSSIGGWSSSLTTSSPRPPCGTPTGEPRHGWSCRWYCLKSMVAHDSYILRISPPASRGNRGRWIRPRKPLLRHRVVRTSSLPPR